MKNINISELQKLIKQVDYKNHSADKYFYKLSEETGELAKAIRNNERMDENKNIKSTIEEELYDVLY